MERVFTVDYLGREAGVKSEGLLASLGVNLAACLAHSVGLTGSRICLSSLHESQQGKLNAGD